MVALQGHFLYPNRGMGIYSIKESPADAAGNLARRCKALICKMKVVELFFVVPSLRASPKDKNWQYTHTDLLLFLFKLRHAVEPEGGEGEADGEAGPPRKKTRKEVLQEVILKSKMARGQLSS